MKNITNMSNKEIASVSGSRSDSDFGKMTSNLGSCDRQLIKYTGIAGKTIYIACPTLEDYRNKEIMKRNIRSWMSNNIAEDVLSYCLAHDMTCFYWLTRAEKCNC